MAIPSITAIEIPQKSKGRIAMAIGAVVIIAFIVFARPAPELIVNGLFLGAMIALGAIGISLIYGILRFAHIAHGDFMTFGAYVTFFLVGQLFAMRPIGRFRKGRPHGLSRFGICSIVAEEALLAAQPVTVFGSR